MKHLPGIGKATKEEIKAHLEQATEKKSNLRHQLFRDWEYNRLYLLNHQWLEPAIGADGVIGSNGNYTSPFLQPMVDGDEFAPRPVHNEILPIVQNEVARCVLSGSKPTVPPNDGGPKIKEAAKLAQDVLLARDAEIDFNGLKRRFVRSMTTGGLGIFISEQQTDYQKTIRAPKPVLGCVACRWQASVEDHEIDEASGVPIIEGPGAVNAVRNGASPLNFRMSSRWGQPVFDGGVDSPTARMEVCPECGGQLMARDADGLVEADYAGNALFKDTPLGDIFTGVMAPMDWFPAAGGRVDPDGIVRQWASEQIVSLDYLSQFYEDGYKVEGDDQELRQLARWHPQGFEDGTYVMDAEARQFENQAVLRREVRLPYFEKDDKGNRKYYDRGRFTVMAGNVVLVDDHLMLQDERSGDWVPRCKIHTAPWEPIDGSAWGVALITYLRSPQDNENTAFAQAIEARHTFGNPKMYLGPGQNIEYLGETYGGMSNSTFRWIGGNTPPQLVQGLALNEQWKAEVQEYKEALQRIASSRDVEQGQAPAGVTAAAALRLLSEAATVSRGPRIAAITAAVASFGKHRLQLMGIIYREPRDFKAGGRGDRISIQSFIGLDLMGQCDVVVNVEPFVESAVIKAQATSEALANQTLVLKTAGDRARYLASQGVPADIAPGESLQVQNATEEWLKYVQNKDDKGEEVLTFGEAPVVKTEFDDDAIHYEQHTIDQMSWEGKVLRERWNEIESLIFGWKEEYEQVVNAEMMLKAEPPQILPPKPEENPMDGTVDPEMLLSTVEAWQKKKDLAAKIEAMPKLPEMRILQIWEKKLTEGGFVPREPVNGGTISPDSAFLRFLAHNQFHKSRIQAAAMAMPPAPGAPGQAPPQA